MALVTGAKIIDEWFTTQVYRRVVSKDETKESFVFYCKVCGAGVTYLDVGDEEGTPEALRKCEDHLKEHGI